MKFPLTTLLAKTIWSVLFILIIQNSFGQNASVHFDGTDDYIQTNVPPIASGAARTVEAWIKTTSNTDPNLGGVQNVIVDMGVHSTGNRFTLNVLFNYAIRLEVQGNGLSGTIPVNDGLWHHVAGVYNPAATNKISLYVDGVLDVAGNLTVAVNTSATGDVVIGRRADGLNRFNGNIDEVRIWSVAKTQAEIQASMNKELCNTNAGLYAYFPLNDGVPNGNNANAVTYDLSGANKVGNFVNFNLSGNTSNFSVGKVLLPGMTLKDFTKTACNSFTWPASGLTYTTAGTYFTRKLKSNGCDSVMRLKLSMASTIYSFDTVSACDTFTWSLNGIKYANSGTYTDTVVTTGGCDSIVTLSLTVGIIPPTVQRITACDSYTWNVNGITYTNSTNLSYTYVNSRGCDSVVILDLTLNRSSNSIQNVTSCDSYLWTANGQTYHTSGQYLATIKNKAGCDSNLTLNLTINTSYKIVDLVNACVEYTWFQNGKKYTETTRDSVVYQNSKGCDSIIVLDLRVKKVNVGVTASSILLFAQFSGGNYQWIDCNTLTNVVGETNQTFYPKTSGTYAVIVTYNGCSDTSNCFVFNAPVGIDNKSNQGINIYPNPCKETIAIKGLSTFSESIVEIYNTSGQLILNTYIKGNETIIITTLPQGIYLLKLNNSYQRFVKI